MSKVNESIQDISKRLGRISCLLNVVQNTHMSPPEDLDLSTDVDASLSMVSDAIMDIVEELDALALQDVIVKQTAARRKS